MNSDHHNAPSDPKLEKHHTPEQTQALEERVRSLESLLTQKGLVATESLDKIV